MAATAPAEVARQALLRPGWTVDVAATLRPLWQGPRDPAMRLTARTIERASRTPHGPASLRLEVLAGNELRAQAWGPGAEWELANLPGLLGGSDRPDLLEPHHAIVAELARRRPGLRMTRTGRLMESLLPAVLGQKVTGHEARRSYSEIVARLGVPAPGPLGLVVPPPPEQLAAQPDWFFHRAGVERRRADILRRAATVAARLEEIADLSPHDGRRRLMSLNGIGPWTAAETMRPALGDPDAISVGDYHVPSLVSWLLAGEARGEDARMLELLEPYRGQRARVVMLLESSGRWPPRHGARMAPRSIRRI